MKVIGAIIAGVLIAAVCAVYIGGAAAAVIGLNVLFGTTFSPWTGVVLCGSAVVITVAAKLLLRGDNEV